MKNKRLKKIIAGILIALAVIAAAAWLLFHHLTGSTNYLNDSDVDINEDAYETEALAETEAETQRQPHPEEIYDLSGVSKATDEEADGTYTILIIGGEQLQPAQSETESASEGETGSAPEEAAERPDAEAVITMTINHNTKEVILYSFHTDLYVEIPGFGGGRLGNAYAIGGGPLLLQTMEENYGLSIDNYAMISFKDVAEVIGIPEFETLDISNDGLVVVEELVHSLGAQQPMQVAGYISKLLPFVTHNLTSEDLMRIILQIPKIVPYYGDKGKIPDGTAYAYQELDGFIVPDAAQLSTYLKDRLYPQTENVGTESIGSESAGTENAGTESIGAESFETETGSGAEDDHKTTG